MSDAQDPQKKPFTPAWRKKAASRRNERLKTELKLLTTEDLKAIAESDDNSPRKRRIAKEIIRQRSPRENKSERERKKRGTRKKISTLSRKKILEITPPEIANLSTKNISASLLKYADADLEIFAKQAKADRIRVAAKKIYAERESRAVVANLDARLQSLSVTQLRSIETTDPLERRLAKSILIDKLRGELSTLTTLELQKATSDSEFMLRARLAKEILRGRPHSPSTGGIDEWREQI